VRSASIFARRSAGSSARFSAIAMKSSRGLEAGGLPEGGGGAALGRAAAARQRKTLWSKALRLLSIRSEIFLAAYARSQVRKFQIGLVSPGALYLVSPWTICV
jgi:hypothetical protein